MQKKEIRRFLSGVLAAALLAAAPIQAQGAAREPIAYDPVVAGNDKIGGFYNGVNGLDITLTARYNAGMMSKDGGSSEIVEYNSNNQTFYAVNGVKGTLDMVSLAGLTEEDTVTVLGNMEDRPENEINMEALLREAAADDPLAESFQYGDMTSLAISPDGAMAAVALQDLRFAEKGRVAIFSCEKDGGLTFSKLVETGVQPDMITFTADGTKILTADEGEPREGSDSDPKGSVTIIDAPSKEKVETVYFDSFDSERAALSEKGVILRKETAPSVDLEPEYIAVSGDGGKAYVGLQEANAIAVLDIGAREFTKILSLGLQDHGTAKLDLLKDDKIELANQQGVFGIRMPDSIALSEAEGKTFLLTANEGDSRGDWPGLDNEVEEKTSPTGNIETAEKVVWFDARLYDGLDQSKAYIFGGRSFSMYEVTEAGLELRFDSGSDFEKITAEKLPGYFNCSNDKITPDNRSGKKGPEPESVTVGKVGDKTYAFIALERIGGIMVYDITDPAQVNFVNYINSREFEDKIQGDVAPEGLCFIPGEDSPTGESLLLASCEVSGTVAAYTVAKAKEPAPPSGLEIAVISDTHLYDAELGVTGAAFEAYLESDRKMIAESEQIVDEALKRIGESDAEVVLIAGDLTKDGEAQNHRLLAGKLSALEAKGKRIFIINGNHDISNPLAVRFNENGTVERVETVDRADFREIYRDFGYGEAVASDKSSLSYAVDLNEDYRLIAIDSCKYNDDKLNPMQWTEGELKGSTMSWIKEQLAQAIKDGKRPIGMMHHGLVPHVAIQPQFFPEYLIDNYDSVARELADAGLNLVFTGHFHSQDVSVLKTEAGSDVYDVETGSLLTAPVPIRYVTLSGSEVSYTSQIIDSVKGLEDKGDFQTFAREFLMSGLEAMVPGMIAQATGMDEAAAEELANQEIPGAGMTVKKFLSTCMSLHYLGDEEKNPLRPQLALIAGILSGSGQPLFQLLGQSAHALITDMGGANTGSDIVVGDNEAKFTLSALPEPDTGGGGGGSGGGGSGSGSTEEAVTETTTTDTDGTRTTVKKDKNTGTVTTTVTMKDGTVSETVEKADGSIKAKVTVPSGKGNTVVSIPVSKVEPGMVAVLIREDGTEEIIKKSAPGEKGILVPLSGSASLKILDNAKKFSDMQGTAWARDAVDFVTARELFSGTGSASFSPEEPVTRGMLVTVLHSLEGKPAVAGNPFADVKESDWFAQPVAWAAKNGLTSGEGAGFNPQGNISREQIAVMLYKYAKMAGLDTGKRDGLDSFNDRNAVSDWAVDAVKWAVGTGILSGSTSGTLNASGQATRAEAAAIMMNFVKMWVK